ncbi:MAG: DNA adenine methylase [Collinsella sp.]
MAVRYIGSKARLAETILDIIGAPDKSGARFVDAFCGTGIVARTAALRGYSVVGNDTLLSATILAHASLLDHSHVNFSSIGSYEEAVQSSTRLPVSEVHLEILQPCLGE